MKKSRLHQSHTLAASFVVTFGATELGCKKESDTGGGKDSVTVNRQYDGNCYLNYSMHCPKNASCNPPPPMQVDCPANLRDAAADPPVVSRRPAGKEDWLRVTPQLWPTGEKGTCEYAMERFCPPPTKAGSCTEYKAGVKVPCKIDEDAGSTQVESFVYKDGTDVCRKIPAFDCKRNNRGSCVVPEGEPTTCP